MPYHTGDTIPTETVCKVIRIPDDPTFRRALSGALLELTYPYNWEKVGDLTPDEQAQAFLDALFTFETDECEVAEIPIIGEMRMYTSDTLPDGWLLCDGTQYLIATYPDLYAVLGDEWWIFPPDTDYFYVPNLVRRVPLGAGDTFALGRIDGEETHTLTEAEMPFHNHAPLAPSTNFATLSPGTGSGAFVGGTAYRTSATTAGKGGGSPHNNMPPYQALNFMIYSGVLP